MQSRAPKDLRYVTILAFIGMSVAFHARGLPNIQVVTEQFPPYNYAIDGQIQGISTEVVQAVFAELQLAFKPQVVPWARALLSTEQSVNTLIYSIGRIKKREKRFQWVGVIAPAKNFLFGHVNRAYSNLESLENAKSYRILTVNKSVREQYLQSKGFEKDKQLLSVFDYHKGLQMFADKKADLWAMNEFVAYYHVQQAGLKVATLLKPVLSLEEISPEGYYMAFGKKTEASVVKAFQKALSTLKENGRYQQIVDRFLQSL